MHSFIITFLTYFLLLYVGKLKKNLIFSSQICDQSPCMSSYTIHSLEYYKSVNPDNQSFTCNKELVPSIYHYFRFIRKQPQKWPNNQDFVYVMNSVFFNSWN